MWLPHVNMKSGIHLY